MQQAQSITTPYQFTQHTVHSHTLPTPHHLLDHTLMTSVTQQPIQPIRCHAHLPLASVLLTTSSQTWGQS